MQPGAKKQNALLVSRRTLSTLFSLLHHDSTTVQLAVVKCTNSRSSFPLVSHFHEPKTFGFSRVIVKNNFG